MANALIDRLDCLDGTSAVAGMEIAGDTTIIPTENLEVKDTSKDGIVLSAGRSGGCDSNAHTTIHTPLSTQTPSATYYGSGQ